MIILLYIYFLPILFVFFLFLYFLFFFYFFFFLFFFFFFQAEDGIRDHCVTEVQTCALPIFPAMGAPSAMRPWSCFAQSWIVASPSPRTTASIQGNKSKISRAEPLGPGPPRIILVSGRRSEERRVGKECRARWWREECRRGGG